jgi:hypothetical protein
VEKVSSVAAALVMDNRNHAAVLCAGVGRGAPVVTLQDASHLCWIERANIVNDIITRMVTGA